MKKIAIAIVLVLLTGCAEKEEPIKEEVGYTTHYENYSVTTQLNDENPRFEEVEEVEKRYILNTNSMKFHLSSCNSAKILLEENREEVYMKRQDIIDMGYTGCANCNPR